MKKNYETDRLILKVLDESYAEMALDYFSRNRDFLKEWDPIRGEEFYTKEYQGEQLKKEFINMEGNNFLKLWIFKKTDLTRTIGYISISNIIRGAFLSCHLGYKLDKDEINNGYMTEAAEKIKEIAFNEYGLHRIEANIIPRNKRSLRVAEKAGFYNEGLAYKYLRINGKWEDHVHMVVLNDNM